MPTSIVLGGTGPIGQAVSHCLLRSGWNVVVVARTPNSLPPDLVRSGAVLKVADARNLEGLRRALTRGADLLVDCVCYTATDANRLLPFLADVGSTVMVSSKAVYVDDAGNHVNSPTKPLFTTPITEQNPTLAPRNGDYDTAEGYGPNKIAAEHVLLDSGHPVTVLRASKVHGVGASPPREWMFVKRVLDKRKPLFLRRRGESIGHTTAAVNLAALVQRVAQFPGRRILNSADPDAPSVIEIARTISAHFKHEWDLYFVDETSPLGKTPWDTATPIILDMSAAMRLGYAPVGTYAETIRSTLNWLTSESHALESGFIVTSPLEEFLDYTNEDAFLLRRTN
ncbi:NAD-dependent epimerase/dehydratase family protein [Nocardiopsis baichengensis]|uniref:NAD-dependent epimerase/dehydratase family protein n=1 Tax=Nocardiopsis baichengensis TaxID=280240 RepID=UPI00308405A2